MRNVFHIKIVHDIFLLYSYYFDSTYCLFWV